MEISRFYTHGDNVGVVQHIQNVITTPIKSAYIRFESFLVKVTEAQQQLRCGNNNNCFKTLKRVLCAYQETYKDEIFSLFCINVGSRREHNQSYKLLLLLLLLLVIFFAAVAKKPFGA